MIFFKAEDPVKSEVVVSIPYIVSIIRKELKSHLKSKWRQNQRVNEFDQKSLNFL